MFMLKVILALMSIQAIADFPLRMQNKLARNATFEWWVWQRSIVMIICLMSSYLQVSIMLVTSLQLWWGTLDSERRPRPPQVLLHSFWHRSVTCSHRHTKKKILKKVRIICDSSKWCCSDHRGAGWDAQRDEDKVYAETGRLLRGKTTSLILTDIIRWQRSAFRASNYQSHVEQCLQAMCGILCRS